MINEFCRHLPALLFAALFWLCGCSVKPGLLDGEYRHDALGHPCRSDMVLEYSGFTLGYDSSRRQALWVSYILSGENLRHPVAARSSSFFADPRVPDAVQPGDYRHSGYDRGHLAPAADMAYALPAMKESFYMTNISPQFPECNRRVWLSVENTVRTWALREEFLYVVTGPYFAGEDERLGNSRIAIPDGFYKAVLDLTAPYKMIALLVPNQPSGGKVQFMTVDELENMSGYDFFDRLTDELENVLEASGKRELWEDN
ncbi:MAG: DNA/RNA non-specific endonuclease [Lentisphaeria bacterium]|nr:DNA/RNA non-specific endonuclease [Lentisphaeria bacterium]